MSESDWSSMESEAALLAIANAATLPQADNLAALHRYLSEVLHRLLEQYPARMHHIAYRLDLDESAYEDAFYSEHPADALATLIIQRRLATLEHLRAMKRPPQWQKGEEDEDLKW